MIEPLTNERQKKYQREEYIARINRVIDYIEKNIDHDDPKITEEEKLRTSVCLTIPKETPVDGEFGKMTVHGGAYAIAGFELADNEFQQAWDTVYGAWLPDSGYQPDNHPCLEIYHNDPKEHPENKHIVDICIPVKPL